MSERKERRVGHYWVKCENFDWEIAIYTKDGWFLFMHEVPHDDTDFAEIDERRVERAESAHFTHQVILSETDAKELARLRDIPIATGFNWPSPYWDVEKFMDDWRKKVEQLRAANGLPPLDPAP